MRKSRRAFLCLLAGLSCMLAGAAVLFSGCGQGGSGKPAELTASDGMLQCRVPAGWEDVSGQLNSIASLEAANKQADQYMIAILESKADFDQDLGLEGYSKIVVDNMVKTAEAAEIVSSEEIQLNGNKAVLTKLATPFEDINIIYWLCAEEFPSHYVQIMGWTLSEKAEESEADILSVIESVKVISQESEAEE